MCIRKKVKYFTQEEIDNINDNGGYLIIVNNNIIDIKRLINNHPGGNNCLIKKLGTDCTKDLNFHSKSALKILKTLEIGRFKK